MARALAPVRSIDHIVLTCKSVQATISWYTRYLGMAHETFGGTDPAHQRHALRFGTQKLNLHQAGNEFEPKATLARPGTADLCFIIQGRTNLEAAIEGFQRDGVDVLEGAKVVERTGAVGKLRSIYVRDPDGNLIELSEYQQ